MGTERGGDGPFDGLNRNVTFDPAASGIIRFTDLPQVLKYCVGGAVSDRTHVLVDASASVQARRVLSHHCPDEACEPGWPDGLNPEISRLGPQCRKLTPILPFVNE